MTEWNTNISEIEEGQTVLIELGWGVDVVTKRHGNLEAGGYDAFDYSPDEVLGWLDVKRDTALEAKYAESERIKHDLDELERLRARNSKLDAALIYSKHKPVVVHGCPMKREAAQ